MQVNTNPRGAFAEQTEQTGGAGLQADIKTMTAIGVYAAAVVTCITVQNSRGVKRVEPLAPDLVEAQVRAVIEDHHVTHIKIGMVGSTEIAQAIHSILIDYPEIKVVYDPVFSTENNGLLSDNDLVDSVRELLLPLTTVLTPNIFEAHILTPGSDTAAAAAMGILETGCENVLLTGTHGKTSDVVHALYSNHRELEQFHYQRLPHKYHGSGFTLASSVAAQIALGQDVLGAVRKGLEYTRKTLLNANRIGMGQYHPNRFFWDKK